MHVERTPRDLGRIMSDASHEIDRLKRLVDLLHHQLGQRTSGVSHDDHLALQDEITLLKAQRDEARANVTRLEAAADQFRRERDFLQSKLRDRAIATERQRFEEVSRDLDD